MILNTHYAYGAGVSGAVIVVTAPTGSTVTATLDGTVYTAQEINGTWTFKVRKFGTYTVTATLGNQTANSTVDVTEKTTYEVALAYTFTVKITRPNGAVYDMANVKINGVTYNTATTLQVNTGTIITLIAKGESTTGLIYVNNVKVKEGENAEYNITPNTDTNIRLEYSSSGRFGMVYANY